MIIIRRPLTRWISARASCYTLAFRVRSCKREGITCVTLTLNGLDGCC